MIETKRKPDSVPRAARNGSAKIPDTSRRRPVILVVDDTIDVRDVLRSGLWHYGCDVWAAASGPEAVDFYREHRAEFDMVLLDVQMSIWDGPRTLSALREVNPRVRCCFMSGDTGDDSEADLLRMGAERVFEKPFVVGEMVESLKVLIFADKYLHGEILRWANDGEFENRSLVSARHA
jgi:CheY-like chemotaxis protein